MFPDLAKQKREQLEAKQAELEQQVNLERTPIPNSQAVLERERHETQAQALQAIKNSPPNETMIRCVLYLLEYEPALSEFQLFHRNEWQEAAFEGDRRKMQKHYLAMKEALGRDFLGTYWDVDEIMSDETKIRKILAEAQYYRDFQAKKRLRK